jgi:hypothetical protein
MYFVFERTDPSLCPSQGSFPTRSFKTRILLYDFRSAVHIAEMISASATPNYSRGRHFPRPSSSSSVFDMDNVNTPHTTFNVRSSPYYNSARSRTPSPVRRSPYGSPTTTTTTNSPPPSSSGLSRNGSMYSHPPLSPSSLGDMKTLNRSSVSYLRNLSEFTKGEDSIYGLGIPDIEKEEVPGTAGRIRLARGESQKVYQGGKLWVDKQRQAIQTYEYLCHVGEAKQYVS